MRNNPKVDLVNVNTYVKFGQIPCSQDTEQKPNSDIFRSHKTVVNLPKLTGNNPNLHLVKVNYAKFD